MTQTHPRSAPAAWGDWPPAQARFDDALKRAHAAACWIALERGTSLEAEIEVWMHAPVDFASTSRFSRRR